VTANSVEAILLFDLAVIALAVVMLVFAGSQGLLRRDSRPRAGRYLIIAAVLLTACFYLAELFLVALPVRVTGVLAPAAAMELLHAQVRAPLALLSVGLTVCGFIVLARQHSNLLAVQREVDERIRMAEQSVIQSETRFRSLVEQTPDAIYCFEFNPPMPTDLPVGRQIELSRHAVLVECNRIFARNIQKQKLSDALGTRFGDLDSAKDLNSHSAFFSAFVRGGYRLVDYEQVYVAPSGQDRALKINVAGVVSDGKLHRMWGSERNVLDIRLTKAALAERLRYLEFMASISTRLNTATIEHAAEVLTSCLGDTCRYFGADRTTLIWYSTSKLTASRGPGAHL
jgi:hypothetical protein